MEVDIWDLDSGKRVLKLQQPKSEGRNSFGDSMSTAKPAGSVNLSAEI
jgi:hypothetical protein